MGSITINYPDALGSRILNAFCEHHGYQSEIRAPDNTIVPNPETKLQFLKRKTAQFIKDSWKANEIRTAQRVAALSITDIDSTDIS
jgi:hypothetical protein